MKLLVLLACVAFATAEGKRYDGYQVLEFSVQRESQRDVLDELRTDSELDFWTETPVYGQPINVMVPPPRLHGVKMLLRHAGITYSVITANVQEEIDAERERLNEERVFDINDYNTFEDIESELPAMAARCDASLTCTVYSIGQSTEGRDLWVLSISGGAGRPYHFLDSTIHAREWLATATNLYILDYVINNYGSDADVTNLVDNYDLYFLPVVNPDGYVWSWDEDRMWRKSRNNNAGSGCIGTDLNRNFEYMWSTAGSSDQPCSDTYHGSGPASEPETQAVQAEADRLGGALSTSSYTSIHTYGNMWMHSYGYENGPQCARTVDHDDQYQAAEATAQAIMDTHNTRWTYGTICETIYAAAGGTIDSTYELSGIKYSFTPELRGNSFIAPPEDIVISFEEVWNGILAMVAEIEVIEG